MGLFSKLVAKFSSLTGAPSEADLTELERDLLQADLGPQLITSILQGVRNTRGDLRQAIVDSLLQGLLPDERSILTTSRPTTIMVVGVNGTGKTTSVAKLAHKFQGEGRHVLVTAADTFRAAAVEQLQTWAERAQVSFHRGAEKQDPAAVAFDGARRAKEESFDVHIIDTAGRLHTESNLMGELAKVRRVVEKVTPVDETLLVLDATTGQNAIVQAREFMAATPITGLILTKMDGSARGGSALAVERELRLPIKFLGTGEGMADIESFQPQSFVESLF